MTDVEDVFQTGGTAQYGHMISPEGGRIIKFTTFTSDNPPILEKGKPYTIYSSFLQGFINNAGEVELNINIKPQNLYKEKGGLTSQQEYFQKELRGSVYTSIVEPIDPGGFKKFTGQPPEPKAVKPLIDTAVGTTIEDGKIVVITKSGRRLSTKEYENEFGIISGNKKLSDLVFDEPELRSKHLTYDQLAAIGLLPTGGALELGQSEPQSGTPADPVVSTAIENGRPVVVTISGKRMSAEEYYAEDINPLDYKAGSQRTVSQKDGAQEISESLTEAYDVSSELAGIWDQKLSEVYPRYQERVADISREEAEGTLSPFRKYLPVDVGLTALDVLGAGLYPLAFPSQAYWGTRMGISPMEGIRKEVTPAEALEIENPWAALLADIALDPLNLLAGAGMVGKVRKAESLWDAAKILTPRNLPEFLRSEEAVLGGKAGGVPSSAGVAEAAQVEKQAELTAMEGAVPEQPLKPVAESVTKASVPSSPAMSVLTPEEQAWAEQAWKDRAWEDPQSETLVTLKELRRKKILLNKAADDLHPNSDLPWKKAAIGAGVAGIGVGAYTLSQILKNNQRESITDLTAAHGLPTQEFNEFPFPLQIEGSLS